MIVPSRSQKHLLTLVELVLTRVFVFYDQHTSDTESLKKAIFDTQTTRIYE